jgi:hypothetical protein
MPPEKGNTLTPAKIRPRLSTACCALLTTGNSVISTTTSAEANEAQLGEPWTMNIGVASYLEKERNTGIELLVDGSRAISEDQLSIRFELDVITGATPNGATASNVPQTFTMSSGIGSYTVGAGKLPVDDTHMDTRLAVSMLYDDEINTDFSVGYKAHLSMEFDYLSFGAGISLKHDFNQHNTSLVLDLNSEYNLVHPVGNIPIAFASMQPPGAQQPRGEASTSKRVNGISFGINQIINPRSLVQIKYSYALANGYLTDPYKILSVIEQNTGNTLDYVFENRPDERIIQSIYSAYKAFIYGDTLDLSYRYYWDDWDIKSHTVDIRYRKVLTDKKFIQPHLRYYHQTAAKFFKHSLVDDGPAQTDAFPDYASADFRLAEFDAYTVGFKYGKQTGNNTEHSINVEYYTQIGNSHPNDAIGLQKQQDLFPRLHTLVLFYNYAFKW